MEKVDWHFRVIFVSNILDYKPRKGVIGLLDENWKDRVRRNIQTLFTSLSREEAVFILKEIIRQSADLPLFVGDEGAHIGSDDCDGEVDFLQVLVIPNGDMAVHTHSPHNSALRFRNGLGGGLFPSVWNVLRILLLAIDMDKERGRP